MLLALRSLWETAVTTTLPNRPGRVYKSTYPYWKPRKKPYWETDEEFQDEEEVIAMLEI